MVNASSYYITLPIAMNIVETVASSDCPRNAVTNISVEVCGSANKLGYTEIYLTTSRAIHAIHIGYE